VNSLKFKIIASILSAVLAVFIFLDVADASKDIDGFQFFLKLITGLGFSVACVALISGGRIALLNNATMLVLGLPSLLMVGISLWGYFSGSLDFQAHQLIPLAIYGFGIVLAGSIANEAEARGVGTEATQEIEQG
tara:strand:- start:174 stop:578 length:405 start_codon:yes stop_codon:yes gene_type:complete